MAKVQNACKDEIAPKEMFVTISMNVKFTFVGQVVFTQLSLNYLRYGGFKTLLIAPKIIFDN